MKNLKYVLASFIFLSPLVAFGAVSGFEYSPNTITVSNWYTTPVSMTVYMSDPEDKIVFFQDGLYVNEMGYGDFIDGTTVGVAETFQVFNGTGTFQAVITVNSKVGDCMGLGYATCVSNGIADLGTVFTVLADTPAPTGLFSFRNLNGDISTSPADLVASVGVVSGDTFSGALPYMLVVIGVGVAFYVIQNLKQVIPADKKGKKRYDIITEKSKDGTYHASFRETKQK